MMAIKGEDLTNSKDFQQLLNTYTRVFQVVGADLPQAENLAKDFIHESLKRAALRLAEPPDAPNRASLIESIKADSSSSDLIALLSENFSPEDLAFGFAQGYTEIFGAWFEAVSGQLTDDQKQKIENILKNYQTQALAE